MVYKDDVVGPRLFGVAEAAAGRDYTEWVDKIENWNNRSQVIVSEVQAEKW